MGFPLFAVRSLLPRRARFPYRCALLAARCVLFLPGDAPPVRPAAPDHGAAVRSIAAVAPGRTSTSTSPLWPSCQDALAP
jgi:hypothetical protein